MRLPLPGADGHLQYCLRMVLSTGHQQQQGFSQVHDWFQNWISSSSSAIFELVVVARLRVWSWTEESTVYDPFRHASADQSSNRRIFHMPRSERELLFLSGHIVVQLGIRICHSIMKEYIDINPKNFICYTATVQQATFRTDLDLCQAGLGLSVQFRIKLRC